MTDNEKALALELVDALACGYAVEPTHLSLAERALVPVAPAALLSVLRKVCTGTHPSNTEIKRARAAL